MADKDTTDTGVLDPRDGGYASRKLWLTVGTSVGIFLSGLIAAWWPAFATNLQTVVGGLLAALGVYAGANVTNSWLTGKNVVQHNTAVLNNGGDKDDDDKKVAKAEDEVTDGETC